MGQGARNHFIRIEKKMNPGHEGGATEPRPTFTLPVVEVPKYRALALFIAWGRALAAIMLVIPTAIGYCLAAFAASWWALVVGICAGCIAAFLILVVRDLARVISDMLLPR